MITVNVRQKKRKNAISLYLDINMNGERIWQPLDFKIENNDPPYVVKDKTALAEQIAAKRLVDLISGEYELPQQKSNSDFLKYYKKIIDERPEYERRASVYKHMVNFCDGKVIYFSDVNENFWNRFKGYLINERKHSQYTIHTVLSILKAILNRAVRDKMIAKNPLKDMKEKRPKSTRTYLEFEELQLLNDTPCYKEEVKKAFLFACYTAIRISDVRKLTRGNIIKNSLIIKMEKTKDYVTIPIDEKAKKFFPSNWEQMKPGELIFHLPADSTVNSIIHSWAAAAGIQKRVSFHTSRHTAATLLLTYGASLTAVKEILGHKDERETQIYAKLIDRKKVEAITNLPEL